MEALYLKGFDPSTQYRLVSRELLSVFEKESFARNALRVEIVMAGAFAPADSAASSAIRVYRCQLLELYLIPIIELNPGFTMTFNNRGIAKERSNDRNGALSDYNRTIELNPISIIKPAKPLLRRSNRGAGGC
jgi:tetratricopeptide (TPR) repeat protein